MVELKTLIGQMAAMLDEAAARRVVAAIAAEIARAAETPHKQERKARPAPASRDYAVLGEDRLKALRAMRDRLGPKAAGQQLGISPEAVAAICRNGRGRADFIAAVSANIDVTDPALADLDAARAAARDLV